MKKSNLFLALAAIAFAGAVAFASCEKEQVKETVSNPGHNPNPDPSTQTSPVYDDDNYEYYDNGQTRVYYPLVVDTIHVAIDTVAPPDSLNAILNVMSTYGTVLSQTFLHRNDFSTSKEYLLHVTNSSFKTSLFRAELSRFQYVRFVSQEHDTLNSRGEPMRIWHDDIVTLADVQDSLSLANILNNMGIAYNRIDSNIYDHGVFYIYVANSESSVNVANRLATSGQFSFCIPNRVGIGWLIFNKKRER